ncbi:MAG: carboxypeptidase-like regulatory domain-containing protein [Candidatus Delongbacteria bacterium]|nr:carboxypeptidase-like regulatory domain-containing protein [Candidatus Delongbacteria bacterium]MBN2834113.1 carboxypeptidase-like regulatory domain-containing protein [Candidatus Delongbacteria bacterium]
MKRYIVLVTIIFQILLSKGMIVGKVVDSSDKNPLMAANITLGNTTLGSETDDKGFFYIESVPSGKYLLKCQYVGYSNKYRIVQVKSDEKTILNFEMDPIFLSLPEVELEVDKIPIVLDFESKERKVRFTREPVKFYLVKRKLKDTTLDLETGFFQRMYYYMWSVFN